MDEQWEEYIEQVENENQDLLNEVRYLSEQNKRYRDAIRSARDELGRQSGTSEIPTNITLKGAYAIYEILQKALEGEE